MSPDALRLLDEALKLADQDRAALALLLLESIGEPIDHIERAWLDEAERRFGEIERGEVQTIPWTKSAHALSVDEVSDRNARA